MLSMNKCAIIPKVKNKNNEVVDSRLFKDLLVYTNNNREETKRLYQITKSSEFQEKYYPKLTLDDNFEPTLSSLLENTNLSKVISEDYLLKRLNKEIGYYKKDSDRSALYINNDVNYQKLFKKALNFNKNSPYRNRYLADIIRVYDNETSKYYITVKIVKRDKLNSINASKMEYNYNLNIRLRDILSSYGISVGALTELEERMGINGVTDFDKARTSAEGLIELIRLSKGERGEKALPEEFSHFILEALDNNPLVNRLFNIIDNDSIIRELIGEDYDTYNIMYQGDRIKLIKEAAGKLLAKHLLNNFEIPSKPYKNILNRLIDYIKTFFRKMDPNKIRRAIYEANENASNLASNILNEGSKNKVNLNNIKNTSTVLYQIQERVKRNKDLLQKIIDNEIKRLNIYGKRNPNSKFNVNQQLFIDNLEYELYINNEINGIFSFLQNTLSELEKINIRLDKDSSGEPLNKRASLLRDIRNYLFSYSPILKEIRENLIEEDKYDNNRYGQQVKEILNNVNSLLEDLFIKYNKEAMPLFVEFLKPFTGLSIEVPFGKYKGKVFTTEELIKTADKDISFFDRWLDSMADSSDYMLKILDQAVKSSKENARLSTIHLIKKLQEAALLLEKSGIKNTDWMFEKDSKGNLTGNYISEINHSLYKEKLNEEYERLYSKYGKNPVGEDISNFKKELKEWFYNNVDYVDGKRIPKMSKYANIDFKNLNTAQKIYYDNVINIKAELDALLPEKYTKLYSAPKIRKDLIERIKSSKDIKSGFIQIIESIKDTFIRRSDDSDFGVKSTLQDFDGNEVQLLPVYFTKFKNGESMNDLSTDVTSTLAAYASMAYDYYEMNKVIDTLELGRDLLRDREVLQTQGNKSLIEKINILDRVIENPLSKKGRESYFIGRLNDFFQMQVYGKYIADEGTFGNTKIDKAKLANFVNKVTAMNTLAVNVLSGISNIITGKVMMRIESFSGEFFTQKNTLTADRIYGKYMPEFLAEVGNRVKTNKLALWNELFNVMQEYEQDIKEVNFDRKTWFSRMFGSNTMFLINNAGEHWMQTRTSLALADTYKMKSPEGKIVSLWDAMEVVYINPNNKKLGATLQLKQGYTKEDGSDFTRSDIKKFSRKSAALNERMHGIYNKADRNAIQRLAIGRMGMLFRKWMRASYNRRFKSASYNYDLESWTEGYYISTFRFLTNLVRDMKETQFNLAARWDELHKTEKANIKRAITEVGHFLAVALILGLIDWPEDKEKWSIKMIEYQARRLYTELGVLIPGKSMVTEGLRILKSPAAGINVIEDTMNLTNMLNPFNYMDELQSGKYKGHSTAYKSLLEAPIIPYKTVYRGLHPEDAIPFYKQ